MAAASSSSFSDCSTSSAINNRGRTVPTTAIIGNEWAMRNVGIVIPLTTIRSEMASHTLRSDLVANHERIARHRANAIPAMDTIASAASFLLTTSDVEYGSYVK